MTDAQPIRLRLSRAKGFDLQAHSLTTNGLPAANVARPSKWGNPFIVGQDGKRAECVHLYRVLAAGYLCLTCKASLEAQQTAARAIKAARTELRGHNLACWCPLPEPGQPDHCHAAVLLEVANG